MVPSGLNEILVGSPEGPTFNIPAVCKSTCIFSPELPLIVFTFRTFKDNGSEITAAAPVLPVAPVAPVAPVDPVEPLEPVEPVEPVAPFGPVAPVAPVEPVAPVGPVSPIGPKGPINSEALTIVAVTVLHSKELEVKLYANTSSIVLSLMLDSDI